MQLSQEQQQYITDELNREDLIELSEKEDNTLCTILNKRFPRADVFIVRGVDQFDGTRYIKGAYFDREKAVKDKEDAEAHPNGSSPEISDYYFLLEGTFRDLQNWKIDDTQTGLPLDNLDYYSVLSKLEESLRQPVS
ncbi:MAG: hypothetical protein KJ709_08685 [Nanoarchaeota archaeon]|nr:hypothetical protein [Nanoarchaeota archaeon]